MTKKCTWTFCFIIGLLITGHVFADGLITCEKDYQFCISYSNTMFDTNSVTTGSHFREPNNELVNYLEKNLTNSNFLGFKIKGKPKIEIYKKSAEYYIFIKTPEISKNESLLLTCAKISTECYEQNK